MLWTIGSLQLLKIIFSPDVNSISETGEFYCSIWHTISIKQTCISFLLPLITSFFSWLKKKNVFLLYLKWITNKDLTAHGTLLSIMWQPEWEGSLRENRYTYNWVPLLFTWNYHIVGQLYSNTQQKVFKNKTNLSNFLKKKKKSV